MDEPLNIRLLGSSNNERGDLFTRLARDLFFALGYDHLRLDVHKSGRELDIMGEHRFEPRRVIAECKAHTEKMGGAELNKFYGSLTRERKKHATGSVAGYFVSLSGFTETGIEQELETGDDRLILLDGQKVIDELERSHVIVSRAMAAERAGQCASYNGLQKAKLSGFELLGHGSGYLWAVFYEWGKKRTHFTLIHADGTPLHESIAREVTKIDKLCGGSLSSLEYLSPPIPAPDRAALATKVALTYRQWLGEECGYIYLDGLPADTDLSATRLKLERLFVPLKGTLLPQPDDPPDVKEKLSLQVLPVGEILNDFPHLAILAAPGGGKSTLLKRLATAYAFAERRQEISDSLPKRDWVPLFLRCRELRDRAHRPIVELLENIPRHAGMNAEEAGVFQQSIHDALHAGQALLLVDGLDEISDEGARQVFASHLRTFIAMFPRAGLVLTSREAGFRLVAGVVASACRQARLAPLERDDVLNLCERWHVEVIGDTEKVRAEAKELGLAIWNNERIRQLAENPLLLTTLLVVKRWIGELPRSRAALYREAIRVLVRTWNVEGFAPLDEDETLAQLSYVACTMMEQGTQQIGQKALLKLLQRARQELEAELQFARVSPHEFIERIEYRSSLLMQTGHERIDGELQPVYEFRHLTFQEYLAARGFVEEQYSGRDSGEGLIAVLEPHFADERWQELIPLAAVLAGRKTEELMKHLIASSRQVKTPVAAGRGGRFSAVLYQCIRDEVQITGPTLRSALLELSRSDRALRRVVPTWVREVLRGKFGTIFQDLIEQAFVSGGEGFEQYIGTLHELTFHFIFEDGNLMMSDIQASAFRNALESGDRLSRIRAALMCMRAAFDAGYRQQTELVDSREVLQTRFESLVSGLTRMLTPSDLPCALASSWALVWMGYHRFVKLEPGVVFALYSLWRELKSKHQARYPAWALSVAPLLPRDTFRPDGWGDCDEFLRQAITKNGYGVSEIEDAAIVVAWYRKAPWTDIELVRLIERRSGPTLRDVRADLQNAAQRVTDKPRKRRARSRK